MVKMLRDISVEFFKGNQTHGILGPKIFGDHDFSEAGFRAHAFLESSFRALSRN